MSKRFFSLKWRSVIDGRKRHHVGEIFVVDGPVWLDVSLFEELVH